jgi:galactonate dehydratase
VRISRVRRWAVDFGFYNAVYIQIETEDGQVGEAEVAMRRRTRSVVALIDELSDELIGRDATRIEQISERLYRDAFLGGTLLTIGISAIDQALWDLNARAMGVPVHRLLGGTFRDKVPLYTHAAAGATPEEFAARVRQRVDAGFMAIKTTLPTAYRQVTSVADPGAPRLMSPHHTETEILPPGIWDHIAGFFAAARDEVGPDVHLMLDCHGRFNVANSIRLADALEPFALTFIEEPVPYERPDWLREVARHSSTPIAAGERWGNHMGSDPFLQVGGVAVAQPDVGICGGITAARKIAVLAEARGISIAFHNPFGPLQSAATWHLAATLPNLLISESMVTPEQRPYWDRWVIDAPVVEAGHWIPSQSPGFGPRLNVEALDKGSPVLAYDLGGTR